MRRLLLALLIILALAPGAAVAAPAVSGEFPTGATTLSGVPKHLTQGSDGNVWVVLDNNKIAKVTPAGAVTEYTPAPALANPSGITTGPDGNLWITMTNAVAKISPATPTVDAPFTILTIGSPQGITTGPDNNLWTGSDANVIKIPPANPTGAVPYPLGAGASARGISRGNDGQLWVADFGLHRVVSVTTGGAVTPYATAPTGGPMGTAAGPGTQIAFSDPIASPQEVGLITPGGQPLRIVTPGGSGDPTDVVFGNDSAYWFTRFGANDLLRLTPGAQQAPLTGFSAAAGPRYLTKGLGDTLWVGLETAKKVARVTGVAAGSTPPPGSTGDRTAPTVSSVGASPKTWHLGTALPRFAKKKPVVGTTISFRVDEQSTTMLSFSRLLVGRKVGRRCLAATRARRHRRRCTRVVGVRPSLSYTTTAGLHRLRFQGRLTRRTKLSPGRYRVNVTARDSAGNVSQMKSATFTVLPAVQRSRR